MILLIFIICFSMNTFCTSYGPDFFVLGIQKSGTTSLFDYICQHPDVDPPKAKELYFFTLQDRFKRGMSWYLNQFPKPCPGKITGEATPCYIISERAQIYIKKYFSHAKFIIIMRDPTNRAFSAYNFYILLNTLKNRPIEKQEYRTFEECIQNYFSTQEQNCPKKYISRGLYIQQIKQWLTLFPREQFLFIIFEELIEDPITITNQVFSFLGLKPYYNLNIKKLNTGDYKNRTMTPEIEQFLRDFYRPYNQLLEEFLGRSLPWK